ncbi:TetR/AcrR family transcriptional regulator [Nocardioides sp. zg-DK7169]|uniref:TetR/AcrR family transcriptional regulator n=1 Tax=Nocardioides sp. zg-DK7169 TaxID=2736600 RepID=UPI001554735B|nr:TetR/AcrR family transcriptional regulator [Nocardioides sp. zg-DK7169]NPC96646.1 TetR/AcrR family transcriptional regulator [Nocardioides sp. zg-DK7169]
MPRVDASRPLLDAAERLFAEQGIAQVSDRRIAEAAGNTNHSAVGYYFGGRAGLLRALIERHQQELDPPRRAAFAESDSLMGDIRALVVPLTTVFAALPAPSWRARFLDQAYHDPATQQVLGAADDISLMGVQVYESIAARLAHLDPEVVRARASLMGHIVATVCATVEARVAETGDVDEWAETADFLSDALAGLLEAPITRR